MAAESALHFALKTIGRSTRGGRKPCDLLTAARHNLREIQAELGANGHINSQRMGDNVTLLGPDTAAKVQAQADGLLATVDTSRLKRDHVQAIEVLFSLPLGALIEPIGYFTKCLAWVRVALPLPVLSAVMHMDEAAPHMHALLLPMKDGKHVGGALIDLEAIKRLRESFFQKVAGPAGLKRTGAKVRGQVKQWAIAAVLARCEAMGLPSAMGPLWADYRASIEREPTPHLLALGIDVNAIRPDASKAIAPDPSAIALPARAMDLENDGQKAEEQSCVALVLPTTTLSGATAASMTAASPTKAPPGCAPSGCVDPGPGDLVGGEPATSQLMQVRNGNAERMKSAESAVERAMALHRYKPSTKLEADVSRYYDDGLTRERDEFCQDTTTWDD